jgi:hypothetical protein
MRWRFDTFRELELRFTQFTRLNSASFFPYVVIGNFRMIVVLGKFRRGDIFPIQYIKHHPSRNSLSFSNFACVVLVGQVTSELEIVRATPPLTNDNCCSVEVEQGYISESGFTGQRNP